MNRQIAEVVTNRWAKWAILPALLVVAFTFITLSSKLLAVQDNEQVNWLPANAESTQLVKKAGDFYTTDSMPIVVVYERKSGITPSDVAAAKADVARIGAVKEIANSTTPVIGPITSADKQALQIVANVYLDPKDGWSTLPDTFETIKKAVHGHADVKVAFAGPVASTAGLADSFNSVGDLTFIAAGFIIVVLLLMYRSPILWLWPVLCGLMSVGAAGGLVYLLAKYAGVTVNGQTQIILDILVLGASVDYALLLVARYREELHNFEDPHKALSHALHRAAPAILASGATVALAVLCLYFAEMNSTKALGPVLAVGIGVALVLMTVLLPVMLLTLFPVSLILFAVLGLPTLLTFLLSRGKPDGVAARWHRRLWGVLTNRRWIFWPFVPRFGAEDRQTNGLWAKVGRRIEKTPRPIWIGTAVVLAAVSFGIVQLNANGLAGDEQFVGHPAFLDAAKVQADHFPAGEGSPLQVISDREAASTVASTLAGVKGVAPGSVVGPTVKGDSAYFQATLKAGGGTHEAAATVDRARDALHAIDGAHALVGGLDATLVDTNVASARDSRTIIPIVLGVILLVLILLLRALVAPVLLLATVVLSFAAAVGISALVFHNIFGFAGADTSYPLWVFVFLVALGVDYNIFLMTRVREEAIKHGTRKGSLIALTATGGVITSAGIVLAVTFAALGTLPLVFTAELGFTVAIGVLLDTFIVRSVLVTALNLDIGKKLWWPSKLAQTDAGTTAASDEEPVPVSVG